MCRNGCTDAFAAKTPRTLRGEKRKNTKFLGSSCSCDIMREAACAAALVALAMVAGGASAGLSPTALRPGHGPLVSAGSARKTARPAGRLPPSLRSPVCLRRESRGAACPGA